MSSAATLTRAHGPGLAHTLLMAGQPAAASSLPSLASAETSATSRRRKAAATPSLAPPRLATATAPSTPKNVQHRRKRSPEREATAESSSSQAVRVVVVRWISLRMRTTLTACLPSGRRATSGQIRSDCALLDQEIHRRIQIRRR